VPASAKLLQLGKRFAVLRPIDVRLAVDDVVERCEPNDNARELDLGAPLHQIDEGSVPSADWKLSQHVQRPSVGGPCGAAETSS
jgi:hypothetical protein